MNRRPIIISALTILTPTLSFALPVDIRGGFGFEASRVDTYRRTETFSPAATSNGSQAIPSGTEGNEKTGSIQSYILRLDPTIIVNDSATFFGGLSVDGARGGSFGDQPTNGQGPQGSPFDTAPGSSANIRVHKAYLELDGETGTYRVGRFAQHWGMGAMISGGEGPWDRYFNQYDGVQLEFQFSGFTFRPYVSKITTGDTSVKGSDVTDQGVGISYTDGSGTLTMGLMYSVRTSEQFNSFFVRGQNAAQRRGKTDTKLIDFYISKEWGKLKGELEIPMLSGDGGQIYAAGEAVSYSAMAILGRISYTVSPRWKFQFDAGMVDGDEGADSTFDAIYLNPNFKISNLMLNYNLYGFKDANQSVFYAPITNVQYFKLSAMYFAESWDFELSLIKATARETAQAGTNSFHHEQGYRFAATQNQDDDYGWEVDFNFHYRWNPAVIVEGFAGYHLVGDYYRYTNTANELDVDDSFITGARIHVAF